jgi:hypothetical protein
MQNGNESFQVHLRSLTDFGHELGTQLTGMAQPGAQLTQLAEQAVRLGEFAEALYLSHGHEQAVADMVTVLDAARQAIDFAEDVTNTVAVSYSRTDQQVAAEFTGLRPAGG